MSKMFSALLAGTALALAAAPALADVKSGVDAWDSGNYAGAVKAWRPLAVKGDADAQYNIAQAYRFGRGVPADMKMAEDWYRKAAYQGHEQAEDALGLVMFQNGDRTNAIPYLKRSADRGEPRAQFVYGSVLFNGDVAGKDWPRAYGYMTRSSSAGFAKASSALAQMDQVMPLDQRQQGLQIAQEIETNAARARTSGQMAMATPMPAAQPYPSATLPAPQPYPAASMPSAPGWEMEAPTASVAAPVKSGIRKEVLPPSSAGSMPMRRGTSALPSPARRDRAPESKTDLPEVSTELPAAPAYPDSSSTGFPAYPGGDFPGATGVDSGATYPGSAPATAGGAYPGASYPGAAYPSSGASSYPGSSYPAMPAEPVGSSYPAYPMESAPAPVAAPPAVKSAPAYSSGTWRIQLGAFSEGSRAEAHGNSLRSRIAALNGKQFYKVTAGTFTRLQAGGYGSRAEADSACSAVRASGNACVVVVK